ncbi:hypothetical protein ACOZ4I_11015 [Haloarcula salina]|uniref:hypothetical protein n=1 Tax=Haloarcula salina TaxID=1429914 RepID=UPI003C6FB1E5
MVEDRISDGRRIAQLLASELTGLERGPLADVAVVDADTDVQPTPEGAVAYRVTHDESAVAVVRVTPETARITVRADLRGVPDRDDVSVEDDTLVAHSGAAVKGVVDALVETLDA